MFYILGDRIDKKGALTGGYIDTSLSRMDILSSLHKVENKLSDETKTSKKIKKELEDIPL